MSKTAVLRAYRTELQAVQKLYAAYREAESGRRTPVPDELAMQVAAFTSKWSRTAGVKKIAADLGITPGYLYKFAARGRDIASAESSVRADTLALLQRGKDTTTSYPTQPERLDPGPIPEATTENLSKLSVMIDLNDSSALARFDTMYMLIRREGSLRLALQAAATAAQPPPGAFVWHARRNAVAPPAPEPEKA